MTPDVFRNSLVLTGPTGSGKSRLALELAGALGAEIVAMDSMTLYRGMDVGTAKPTLEDRRAVPHHLLDVLDPWEPSSVAWWLGRAAECCRALEARGRRALFVGGTPLYLKALLYGLFDGPPADEPLRAHLTEEAERHGRQALHDRLARVDPPTAARLHANDVRRVVRALEVWELTGRPISAWQTQWEGAAPSPLRCVWVDCPREELYHRIDARVVQMFADGLVEEVQALASSPHGMSREARQALGYKEVLEHLAGAVGREETVGLVQTRTRQFAKRQLTWFRHLPGCAGVRGELTFVLRALTME